MTFADWLEMKDDVSYALRIVKDIKTRYPKLPVDLSFNLDHVHHTLTAMRNDLEENYAWQPE